MASDLGISFFFFFFFFVFFGSSALASYRLRYSLRERAVAAEADAVAIGAHAPVEEGR